MSRRRRLVGAGLAVVLAATVAFVGWGGDADPAAAAPVRPASAATTWGAAAPAEGIDPGLWAACRAFSDVLELMPFDPRRPLDISEWQLENLSPVVVTWKLTLKGLKHLIPLAAGELTNGLIGTTLEEFFIQQFQEWRPPADKYAPDWYVNAIRRNLECELTDKDVTRPCGELPLAESVEGAFIPDHCWGTYPASNYDLGYNQGGPMQRGIHELWGVTANLLFTLAASAIQLGLWLLGWAFSFDIRDFDPFVLAVSDAYDARLVGPLGLEHAAWVVLIGWAAFNILRNRAGTAAGELLMSFVMVALAALLLGNLDGYLGGAWDTMDRGSNLVLAAGQDRPACDEIEQADPRSQACDDQLRQTLAPVQKDIHRTFIEEPYDYLNWGSRLETPECRAVRDQIVSIGPHGDDGWPRRHMERAAAAAEDAGNTAAARECRDAAMFNAKPSSTRWIGALLNLVMSGIVFVLLALSSVTLLLSKFLVALCFALAPLAAVFAIAPGGGRRIAWQWLGAVAQGILAVLGISLLLSLLLVAMRAVLAATADVGVVERLVVGDLLVIAAFAGRKRIVAGTQSAAASLATKLSGLTPAGAAAGPVSAGMDLTSADARMGRMVTAPAKLAGKIIAQRARERRSWHNIVKARRRGDRMAGVMHKTYYSDAPGGSNGPGPRGGYGDPPSSTDPDPGPDPGAAAPTGPGGGGGGGGGVRGGVGGPRGGAGAAGGRRGGPGPRRRPPRGGSPRGPGQRGPRVAGQGRPSGTPTGRRPWIDAQQRPDGTWITEEDPAWDPSQAPPPRPASGPGGIRASSPGPPPPPGRGAPPHGGGRGPVPPQRGGAPPSVRPAGPAPRRNRLIHEVIVTEQEAPWRFPVRAMSDRFFNKVISNAGRSTARRRGLD